jgi:lipoate-protein ligase A
LLWQRRKIAGAAQRRSRDGLLIQGSIQSPRGVSRPEFEQALCEVARIDWNIEWQSFEPSEALQHRVSKLAREKYARPEYNERR